MGSVQRRYEVAAAGVRRMPIEPWSAEVVSYTNAVPPPLAAALLITMVSNGSPEAPPELATETFAPCVPPSAVFFK